MKGKMKKGGMDAQKGMPLGQKSALGHTEKAAGHGEKMAGHADAHTASFTFSADNASVLTKTTATGKTLDTSKSTFVTTTGTNDLGATAVISVTETRTMTNSVMTETYTDQDGDGNYTETFDLNVATSLGKNTHQFTFNTDGSIATDTIVCNSRTKTDTIDSNEVYQQVVLGADTYITKTTAMTDGSFVFQLFRDDNADGSWSEVAGGHTTGTNIDTTANAISITGIQTLLSTADSLIG